MRQRSVLSGIVVGVIRILEVAVSLAALHGCQSGAPSSQNADDFDETSALIQKLGDDSPDTRYQAYSELMKKGEPARARLLAALNGKLDPESRSRVETLVQRLNLLTLGQIWYTSLDLDGSSLILANCAGEQLSSIEGGRCPAISPNGEKLAYWKKNGGYFALVVRALGSGSETILQSQVQWIGGPAWNSSGERLAWAWSKDRIAFGIDVFSFSDDTLVTANYACEQYFVTWSPSQDVVIFLSEFERKPRDISRFVDRHWAVCYLDLQSKEYGSINAQGILGRPFVAISDPPALIAATRSKDGCYGMSLISLQNASSPSVLFRSTDPVCDPLLSSDCKRVEFGVKESGVASTITRMCEMEVATGNCKWTELDSVSARELRPVCHVDDSRYTVVVVQIGQKSSVGLLERANGRFHPVSAAGQDALWPAFVPPK